MEDKAGVGAVRVLTLNLWGRSGAWDERRQVLADGLRELHPGILAFQEVVAPEGYEQAGDLLGPGFRIAQHGGRSEDGTGAAIASRWPLGELLEEDLRVTPRVDPAHGWIGRLAAVEVLAPDPVGPLLCVHHKPSWQRGFDREREIQAVAAARFVEGLLGEDGTHVVLAGDFDATPDSGCGPRVGVGLSRPQRPILRTRPTYKVGVSRKDQSGQGYEDRGVFRRLFCSSRPPHRECFAARGHPC